MASGLVQVTDEEVEQLAREQGPGSVVARIWSELRLQRARDRQFFAFRFGPYWVTGPMPDAKTEATILDLADEVEEE